MANSTDAAVIAASLADPPEFAALYERHLPAVLAYICRRVGGSIAEDLTAEVFVRAFRGREGYRPERPTALPWLLGIASHVIADNRRSEQQRLKLLQQLASQADQAAENRDTMLSADLVARLRRLGSAERDTLLLVVWGELSYEEAAVALGVPIGTVRSRIARARARLRASSTNTVPRPGSSRWPSFVRGETDV